MRDVVRIDEPVGLRVTAQRIVAHAKRSALRERAVDLLQVLAVSKLELGADGPGPDAAPHSVDQRERARGHQRLDLREGGRDGGAEGTRARLIQHVAACQQGHDLGQRERNRQAVEEGALHFPQAAASIALVVDREASLVKNAEVTPHRPHRAAEPLGRVLDRDSRWATEEQEETPLARMLIPSGHGGLGFSRRARPTVNARMRLLRRTIKARNVKGVWHLLSG
jgi:hypothetical protein